MKGKVAVIAGTLVDTAMGVAYLNQKDPELEAVPYPATDSARAGQLFQLSPEENKRRRMTEIFSDAESRGIRDFFIYCNSLSGVFDFEGFAAERGDRVYTPLQVYRELGARYTGTAVIAANNQSTAGIERSLYEKNPNANVIGLGMLALVSAVEDRRDPEEIVESLGLAELTAFFEKNGVECLILGCTHFPYFREALAKRTALPIIDPADVMYANLLAGLQNE